MQLHGRAGLCWYSFDLLEKQAGLKHASFTRRGGVSPAPFNSLNLGEGLGDEEHNVRENLRRIRTILGIPRLQWAEQEHGTKIIEVSSERFSSPPKCDVLVTKERGVGLMIKHADCQACILYDPIQGVVANVHAGWRGNVQNIYQKTIEYLIRIHQCLPENILACISPSLGPEGAEFLNFKKEFPKELWKYVDTKAHIDLWDLAQDQLLALGLLPEHIEIARLCTWSKPDDFFSYRREGKTGRHASVIALL